MADQDKDRTNPSTGQKTGPGISSADLSGNTQQRTSASGTTSATGSVSGSGSGSGMPGRTDSASDMKDTSKKAVDEAKNYTRDMAGQAKEQGKSMLEQQKGSAVEQVDSAAHAFRTTAQQLQGEGQSQASRYVDMFAEQLESISGQLRHKNMDTLIRDAEDFGRRSPGVFLAGSVVAGFLLSRFLKSSAERPRGQSGMSQDDWRSRSSQAGNSPGDTSNAYESAGSDIRSAYLGSQASESDSRGSTVETSRGSAAGGASTPGTTGSASGSGSAAGGGAAGGGTPVIGADGTGADDRLRQSSPSTASKPGGNTYGNR